MAEWNSDPESTSKSLPVKKFIVFFIFMGKKKFDHYPKIVHDKNCT